ncbi:pro-resilin-like [Penaeus monodon]|uniref:pro-resilin-like n=1 Tax=Penaeus monodon TaxID=6687 RepID=UPI0018A7BF08|nr:pro-resilin-like [Penaeus monodon]
MSPCFAVSTQWNILHQLEHTASMRDLKTCLRLTDNSLFQLLILLTLAAVVAADSRESYEYLAPQRSNEASSESYEYLPPQHSDEASAESFESSEAKYSFNWAVSDDSSSNEFGHQEVRDGDHTQGSYYVQLPDGRLQTVKYFVDGDSGYVAEVNYEGEARYPDSYESFESESAESAESREYRPPRPQYVYDSNESR